MEARLIKPTTKPILVTGGTGTLGSRVVALLRDEGRPVRVLSRGLRGRRDGGEDGVEYVKADLSTGQGVDSALAGTEIIVHCAGTSKGDETKARHLVQAASRAGVRHIVYISVVGADRVPVRGRFDEASFGYFASKLGGERTIAESGVPWTTLRATQFYDLMLVVAKGMARLPVIPAPAGMRFQPVSADEVAARLVELALGEPAGLVPDFGGPKIYELADLVRAYLRASGKRRPILRLPVPGRAARAIRAGANLAPDRAVGCQTWEEFLAARLG